MPFVLVIHAEQESRGRNPFANSDFKHVPFRQLSEEGEILAHVLVVDGTKDIPYFLWRFQFFLQAISLTKGIWIVAAVPVKVGAASVTVFAPLAMVVPAKAVNAGVPLELVVNLVPVAEAVVVALVPAGV